MNCWEDQNVLKEVERIRRKKLVLSGLCTGVCIVLPSIQALEVRYKIYVIADACDSTSTTSNDMAMAKVIQAGAVPMTWLQFLLELQRAWARTETYDAVTNMQKPCWMNMREE
jgi:nicotinamidase-related amidase